MLLLIRDGAMKEILVIISTKWIQASKLIGTERTNMQKIYQEKSLKRNKTKTKTPVHRKQCFVFFFFFSATDRDNPPVRRDGWCTSGILWGIKELLECQTTCVINTELNQQSSPYFLRWKGKCPSSLSSSCPASLESHGSCDSCSVSYLALQTFTFLSLHTITKEIMGLETWPSE